MTTPEDPARDDGVVAAAGRVALYPARAAMRASRTRIEASVEHVLTGPELARIVDAVLAGPFPEELGRILDTFWKRGVKFTINTDGPYLLDTSMREELRLLREHRVLSEEQIDQTLRWAREASFVESAG